MITVDILKNFLLIYNFLFSSTVLQWRFASQVVDTWNFRSVDLGSSSAISLFS